MTVVLAIDAAWTEKEPSGVALAAVDSVGARCLAVAPSYAAFIALAAGAHVDWTRRRFNGSAPDVGELLDAARALAGMPVNLVTIDMPIATVPISGRRVADSIVSRAFGARSCSTHSPNAIRPGALGAQLCRDFETAGFPIATAEVLPGTLQRIMEVYPHPALLALLNRARRIPYKVSKAGRYFPNLKPAERFANLLAEFAMIRTELERTLGPLAIPPPTASTIRSLKPYEDALDALVCAWVGVLYTSGLAIAYGDGTCAIWCPEAVNRLPSLDPKAV